MSTEPLLVGVAETIITPEPGIQIDGNIGARRPVEFVMEDLYARAVVFQQGDERFMLLSMDLLAVCKEWTEAVREAAEGELGFERDAVAVHVVQNHSSPSLGHIMLTDRTPGAKAYPWVRGSDPSYGPYVLERLVPMMREAAETVEPVSLLYGTSLEGRVAFNRRIVMRDGSAEMGLGPDPDNALYREGPSDPEVGVALFNGAGGTKAAFLHHTSHPVHWHPHTAIHGDWPGAWAATVRDELLPGAVPLVLNGCCGNVIHHDVLNPHREDTPQSMARILTDAVRRALQRPCGREETPRLRRATKRFGIPYRDFPEEIFRDARDFIDEHPEPLWTDETKTRFDRSWHWAASLLDVEEMIARDDGVFEYEIQVARIGDLAVVVLPGEPFVQAQLEIKQRSPAKRTFVAHMANRYVGYVPTPEALRRGGYETTPSMGSKLAPEALSMIADTAVEMLDGVFD